MKCDYCGKQLDIIQDPYETTFMMNWADRPKRFSKFFWDDSPIKLRYCSMECVENAERSLPIFERMLRPVFNNIISVMTEMYNRLVNYEDQYATLKKMFVDFGQITNARLKKLEGK